MAHYAKLNEDNYVLEVIVIAEECELKDGVFSEENGIAFCKMLTGHANWRKTSYNRNIRRHYAGPGFRYDETLDVFIPPQPYSSWVLDSQGEWQPPIPRPQDENIYNWDESTLSWKLIPLPESSSDNGA